MESYTNRVGETLQLGSFVESTTHGEAGRLVEFRSRKRFKKRNDAPPIWLGRVEFETGCLEGETDWDYCEALRLAPTPAEVASAIESLPRRC